MTEVISQLDIDAAQRRAERIRFHATNANEAMRSLQKLVHTARELEDHVTLGYQSWTAYIKDLFGDEPLRLARDVRRELVAELADAGMSTRAIAPIVGTGFKTVARDIEESRGVSHDTPRPQSPAALLDRGADPTETLANLPDTFEIDGMTATKRGDVMDEAPARTITGLDGKEYKRPEPREPRPVLAGTAAEQHNADTNCEVTGKALITFDAYTYPSHRARMLNTWWPMGKNNIQPMHAALFNSTDVRRIAAGLYALADEMEARNEYN